VPVYFSWWSNEDRTLVEQTRTVFDLVRVAFASPVILRTDLSRRLRDGVFLSPPSRIR
jgi:hypothetical protein